MVIEKERIRMRYTSLSPRCPVPSRSVVVEPSREIACVLDYNLSPEPEGRNCGGMAKAGNISSLR